MRIKKDFILRQVAGTYMVVPVGGAASLFRGMIKLNDSGALLWKKLETGADEKELVAVLTDRYDIDEATAGKDVSAFLATVRGAGLIE